MYKIVLLLSLLSPALAFAQCTTFGGVPCPIYTPTPDTDGYASPDYSGGSRGAKCPAGWTLTNNPKTDHYACIQTPKGN